MIRSRPPRRRIAPAGLTDLPRLRPRAYAEWKALVRWGKAAPGETQVIGYRLRQLREAAGLTQRGLATRLGVTQRAVSLCERWDANPTWALIVRWARTCGAEAELRLLRHGD